jgi:hypothetical protein
MEKSDTLCFATMRNEALRLPHFFSHHCELGVVKQDLPRSTLVFHFACLQFVCSAFHITHVR